MPDGKHILVLALAPGHAPDNYLQDVETGASQKINNDGKFLLTSESGTGTVSPDGRYFLAIDNDKRYWVQPIDGGAAREVKGLSPGDIPTEWHGGSQNIFFERPIGTDTSEIYDLNLATATSKLWSHFTPADKTAMLALRHAIITQDGTRVLYVVQRIFSTLFVAKGIQ
jgi:hypothetical protein